MRINVEWQSIKKPLLQQTWTVALLSSFTFVMQFLYLFFIFTNIRSQTHWDVAPEKYDEWLLIVCSMWSGNCELTRKFCSLAFEWKKNLGSFFFAFVNVEWKFIEKERKCKLGWMNCSYVFGISLSLSHGKLRKYLNAFILSFYTWAWVFSKNSFIDGIFKWNWDHVELKMNYGLGLSGLDVFWRILQFIWTKI